MLRERVKNLHFVGIGGIGMSGLAQIFLDMGYRVRGSDIKESKTVKILRRKGIKVFIGHRGENVEGADVVVYSSAIPKENVELIRAKELGIPLISRAQMLSELFRIKEGIAISGSHGKTTTTSLIAQILINEGLDPTVIVGGILKSIGSNAKLGNGSLLVSEADESDGTFLRILPTVAVITNVDKEHLGYYKDLNQIKESFLKFLNLVPFYGFCVVNGDDPNVREISKGVSGKVLTYGLREENDLRVRELRVRGGFYTFKGQYKGKDLGEFELSLPGRHNLYNALASILTSLELGVSLKTIRETLKNFKNAERRLEFKGEVKGCPVYDDYGHHPTEIRAVLNTLREMYPGKKLLLIFQPHRYSRTYYLFEEFAQVLKDSDYCLLTEIYPAGEKNIYGVKAEELSRECGCKFLKEKEEIFKEVLKILKGEEVVIFMGAGSIASWSEEFVLKFA